MIEDGGNALLEGLPAALLEPARRIARGLRGAGHQAWIVGGSVRDLVLGRAPKDIDLVTDALPDRVEELFERTVAVGKSFGVIVVVEGGAEFEVATFREERGYSDRRRPDEIRYADDPAVDARRRDFTCNALYLDPLDGRLADPSGGRRDLAAGLLRTVGAPADRFREDGLRLLRMARFAAALGLVPAEGLLEAAREERASLDGVSPERVLDELLKIVRQAPAHRAMARSAELMEHCGLASRSVPGWSDGPRRVALLAAMEELQPPVDPAVGLAGWLPGNAAAAGEALQHLRASNALRDQAVGLLERAAELGDLSVRGAEDAEARGALVETWREPATALALQYEAARMAAEGDADSDAARARWAAVAAMSAAAPPEPIELKAADLMAIGVERGPALGAGLRRCRLASLGGAFADRDGAFEWARRELT